MQVLQIYLLGLILEAMSSSFLLLPQKLQNGLGLA